MTSLGPVSVCMATYNGAAYVRQQLDSILAQLGPEDEVVVVDDASSDNTVDVVLDMGDGRIRLHRHSENRGYARAFETAIAASVNEHIFLADQDDLWPHGRLEAMQRSLATHDLVVGGVALPDGRVARPAGTTRHFSLRDDPDPGLARNVALLAASQLPYYSCAMGFTRDLADLALPFPDSARELPDAWLGLLGLATHATAHLAVPVVERREHDANASGQVRAWRAVVRGRWLFLQMLFEARRRVARRRAAGPAQTRSRSRMPSRAPDVTRDVACVVVHHRSLGTLGATVSSLMASGLPPEALTVVDNSELSCSTAELEAALPADVALLRVANDGYAAAVNVALARVRDERAEPPFAVLVATHEVLAQPDCVRLLLSDLAEDPQLGAVGPVLFTDDGRVWSAGGRLSRLGIPSHRLTPSPAATVSVADWLDGALCLYRWSAVHESRFDERFFLYFEELDFQVGLRRRGWRVAVDGRAKASQATGGMPAFYAARNFRLFQRSQGGPARRYAAVAVWSAQRLLVMLLARDVRAVKDFTRGLVAPLPDEGAGRPTRTS